MEIGGWMAGPWLEPITNDPKPYKKGKPTKKVLKRRARNKAARKARKRNRQWHKKALFIKSMLF